MFRPVTIFCIAAMLHSASACSCLFQPEERRICDAKFIARVFLTSVTPNYNKNFDSNDYNYGNVVLEVYKGKLNSKTPLRVTSRGGNSAACGMEPLPKGTEMIVVGGYDNSTNTVSINLCSFYTTFSKEMFQLHQMIKTVDCEKVPKSEFPGVFKKL